MTEQVRTQRDTDDAHPPIVWPDPSPLNTWWESVMNGDERAAPHSSTLRH